jgi:hypothetical protein
MHLLTLVCSVLSTPAAKAHTDAILPCCCAQQLYSCVCCGRLLATDCFQPVQDASILQAGRSDTFKRAAELLAELVVDVRCAVWSTRRLQGCVGVVRMLSCAGVAYRSVFS